MATLGQHQKEVCAKEFFSLLWEKHVSTEFTDQGFSYVMHLMLS